MQLSPSVRRNLRWSAYANVVLGICVVFAAQIWADTTAATVYGTAIGTAVALSAVASMRVPEARIVTVILALLLCGSMWIVPQGVATDMWLNALAGMAILVATIGFTTDPRGAGAPDAQPYPDDEIGLGTPGPELRLYPVSTPQATSSTDTAP